MLTYKQKRRIKKSKSVVNEIINILYIIGKAFVYAIVGIRRTIEHYYNAKEIGLDYYKIDNLVKKLSPRQFEIFCCELLKTKYEKVVLTPPSNDYGRDIICYDNDGNKIFIECKHYTSKHSYVGREICQKLIGSMCMFGADKGIIINTGQYHRNAYEVADKVDNLELWNEDDIREMILNMDKSQMNKVLMKTMNKAG
jgi:restriction system protein